MPWTSEHIKWLSDTGTRITTADGKIAELWEFNHQPNDATLSAWAKHFRNHYCPDTDIDTLKPSKQSRKDYLTDIKFPDKTSKLGPGIRAGDFGEILVADYLQYILGFWVPRVRWASKIVRDESAKGSDVIGLKQYGEVPSSKDELFVFEAKTKFSQSAANRLQDAINDSAKDHLRLGESLNFVKQKSFEKGKLTEVQYVGRFQNPTDMPYRQIFGAAAIISDEQYNANDIAGADCCKVPKSKPKRNKKVDYITHPFKDDLVLVVIKGPKMMSLVHELYRRAADEA